jgi:hypothetical protein
MSAAGTARVRRSVVTQVRFGGAEAVVVPWQDGRADRGEAQPA